MDRHIKMPINQGNWEDDMMHFQDLYASPAKSDTSSVDIYDGLDMVTFPEQAAEKSSPSRNCLDLYEEIITEEGTAKEASLNDLSAEYEKCQRQMKQLITKMKEMQSMNSSLQNENQCLKKNISALIKTARVEITRKEDEINRLNQRLGAPGWNHSFKPNPLPLLSINKSNNDDLSKNRRNTESLPNKDMNLQPKAISRYSKNLCDKEKVCMENSQACTSRNPIAKQCKERTVNHSQDQALEPPCLELNGKNKKVKILESKNKDTERNRTKEKSKSTSVNLLSESSAVKEKACQLRVKCGKNESSQENKNSQSEVGFETENCKYYSGSTKEKTQLKELDYSKEKTQLKELDYSTEKNQLKELDYSKEKNQLKELDYSKEKNQLKELGHSKEKTQLKELGHSKEKTQLTELDCTKEKTQLKELGYSKEKTQLKDLGRSNEKTQLKELGHSKEKTQLKELGHSKEKTQLKELGHSKEKTQLKELGHSKEKTQLKELGHSKEKTQLKELGHSKEKTQLKELGHSKEKTQFTELDCTKEKTQLKELDYSKETNQLKDLDYSKETNKLKELGHSKEKTQLKEMGHSKEKTQLTELDCTKEKQANKYERSPHIKESRTYRKEKNSESRHKTAEKNEEPRRSKRTNFSTPKDDCSHKLLELNDAKKSSDSAGRREKHSSEHSEPKHGNTDSKPSKSENSTRNRPTHERSDRDRRDKKRSRDEQDRSRSDQKAKGQPGKEKDINQSSSKDRGLDSKGSDQSKNQEKAKEVAGNQKDLKLSFMEILNLTLSPAKKPPDDTQVLSSATSMVEENAAEGSSQRCVIEMDTATLDPLKTDQRQSEFASVDDVTTKASNTEHSSLVFHPEPVADTKVGLYEESPKLAVDESSELLTKLTVEDKQVGCMDLDTVNSEEMDTQCLADGSDFIDLDSFIEIDRCSGSPTSETPNVSMPAEQIKDDGSIVEQSEDADNQAIALKTNVTETPKGICESPDTDLVNVSTKGIENKPCFYDEGSIDLNFIRPIPKVLSPLKSPIRHKAHLHTLERTAKASVGSILHKELLPETDAKSSCLSVSEELNKENCQPENKSDLGCKVASSYEVEEGEILSEDEQIFKQSAQPASSPSQLVPDQVTIVTKSQSGQDGELLPLSKPDTQILPTEKSARKSKSKIETQPKLSECPTSKGRKLSADSCLHGILKIVIPSSVQDILQMLRIIRKHIRKKYMKFKIQFSLTQFHRIIEVAALCFITLIKSLDWTNVCSSPERLQKKLCRHIEARLKKLKKNGIVDRIFEHLIDMKKRLWKFVEEQLDSLFDILKAVMLKLCDKAEGETNTLSCINTQKSDPVKNSQNERSKCKDKVFSPSSKPVPCSRQLAFQSQLRVSNTEPQNDNAMQKELVKGLTAISLNSKNVGNTSSNFNPTPKQPHRSPVKTSMFNEQCFKSQPNSSGLSFNLVSDDHMGDLFKSLLENSDNLPLNMSESIWILGTPEKTVSSSQTFDSVDSLSENKTSSKAAFPWCSISPPHVKSFPSHETVLNPDVLDESCLLEIPTGESSMKSLSCSDDRLKSFSSILMEDLAVSLTVPSPLKSDSHLSFLRPVCDAESISEVEGKCCEGSVLDEEDATEQDIHLTLDSDNSSIGSFEDTGETGSFQYHPSEPMQAVIMERSNDHFIVKIRRAVSSSSPVSDCSPEGTVNNEDGSKLKLDSSLDTASEAHIGSILLHPDDKYLPSFTESSVIDSKSPEEPPLAVQENKSVFKLPPSREVPAGLKLPADDIVELSDVDCEQNVTHCFVETCSPVHTADILPLKTSEANTVNLNSKKRRKSVEKGPLAKRPKISPDKDKGTKHNKTENLREKPNKKKLKRTVSDGAIDFHSSRVSPTSLSAKNVVKKKGEVVVSWTRDEDRAILTECQKLGPSKKTFLFLSSSMNKYPHEVEERFRQLMKLFKKSRNSSS